MTNTIQIRTLTTSNPETVEVGDIVGTTTSSFDYDAVSCNFEDTCNGEISATLQHVGEDYSEYISEKSSTGGCYGFDYWEVLEIHEVHPADTLRIGECFSEPLDDTNIEYTGEILDEMEEI